MDDNIFSQGSGATASTYSSRRRVRRFNPPLKSIQCQSQDSISSQQSVAATGDEGRVHTVLSYCNETSSTQPEDGIVRAQLQEGSATAACSSTERCLDDSLLSNSSEDVVGIRVSEEGLCDEDDTAELSSSPQQAWLEAGNPFSYPSNSAAAIGGESPPSGFEPRAGVCNRVLVASEEGSTGTPAIPRRQFKVPKPKTSAYNFSIVPKELAKTGAKRRQPPGPVCKRRPRLKTWLAPQALTAKRKHTDPPLAANGSCEPGRGDLSVFEFHASQEVSRAAGDDSDSHDGDDVRSRMDVSLSTRTREEQVSECT